MANESVITVIYPVSGLATLTAKILKPDYTVRDSQTAVALTDSGHVNVYTNSGAITIQPGDTIVPYVDSVNYGSGGVYRPDTSAVALRTTVSQIETEDISFRLAAGATDDDAYNDMVISITDISNGETRGRRITDYDGSTRKVTVENDFEFTIAIGDVVRIWANASEGTIGAAGATEIADHVWDEDREDHTTVGTMGELQGRTGSSLRIG